VSATTPPRRSSASSNTSASACRRSDHVRGQCASGLRRCYFMQCTAGPIIRKLVAWQMLQCYVLPGVVTDGFRIRMGWCRSRIKLGGRLALFALAVQFILAFGHIHPDDIYGSLNGPFPTDAVSLATAGQGQFLSSDQSTAALDDFCAICATVSLLGSSVAADAPKLALPKPQMVVHATGAPDAVVIAARWPFQSRAPPSA